MRVSAVLLAAGGSTRMGRPKQLLSLGGRTLVRRAADAVQGSACDSLWVVVGERAEAVAGELSGTPAQVILNPDWSRGLSSSVAVGVGAALARDDPDAILLLVADQPHLASEVLDALVAAFPGGDSGISACAYAGTVGVPALFGRGHFEALRRLEGDRGARTLLARHADSVTTVDFEGGAVDVDTPEDWAALSGLSDAGGEPTPEGGDP